MHQGRVADSASTAAYSSCEAFIGVRLWLSRYFMRIVTQALQAHVFQLRAIT